MGGHLPGMHWRVPEAKQFTPLPSPARRRVSPLGLGGHWERLVKRGTWLRALWILWRLSPQYESLGAGDPLMQLVQKEGWARNFLPRSQTFSVCHSEHGWHSLPIRLATYRVGLDFGS